MIPLAWLSFEGPGRLAWDQDIIDWLCPQSVFNHVDVGQFPVSVNGAVVIIPARYNVDFVPQINSWLKKLDWCVVILTSDEESTFPWHQLHHPNMRLWIQTPHPTRHKNESLRYLPLGWPTHDTGTWKNHARPLRQFSWFFHGQVNHKRRDDMLKHMATIPDGEGIPSPGFTLGMPRPDYLYKMAFAKVAPAPSGPSCADSFRVWEALEAGAVPIVDSGPIPDLDGRAKIGYPVGYWKLLLGRSPPFPVVSDWAQAPGWTQALIDNYPSENNNVFAWWQRYKRTLRRRLVNDITELGGHIKEPSVAVLIPTSPLSTNPDMSHLTTTIESVRARLPEAEILLMIDGIRPEQEHLRPAYDIYVNQVLWNTNHNWSNVVPFRYDDHLHQAAMTRRTLESVTTPLVLFVEHDTPLEGEVDWDHVLQELLDDHVDLVRFYHETIIQSGHEHLMLGNVTPVLIATEQWSQRPHLARTDYYRHILAEHFTSNEKHMIEDRMHSVVQSGGWENHRLALYHPEGNIKRSGHLDARGDDPKWVDS